MPIYADIGLCLSVVSVLCSLPTCCVAYLHSVGDVRPSIMCKRALTSYIRLRKGSTNVSRRYRKTAYRVGPRTTKGTPRRAGERACRIRSRRDERFSRYVLPKIVHRHACSPTLIVIIYKIWYSTWQLAEVQLKNRTLS